MAIDVREWLEGMGLGHYAELFAENDIDLDVLPHLTEQDLKDLGMSIGHRRKLLAAIGTSGTEAQATPLISSGPETPLLAVAGMASAAEVVGERRQVTVLFADLSGFTRLTSEMDAEDTHALLNCYFEATDAVVKAYGGMIDKHIGDAVMAVFGAPVAHTNDPERAVRAALDIHKAVATLDPPLSAHIGIASGQVIASGTAAGPSETARVSPSTSTRASAATGPVPSSTLNVSVRLDSVTAKSSGSRSERGMAPA